LLLSNPSRQDGSGSVEHALHGPQVVRHAAGAEPKLARHSHDELGVPGVDAYYACYPIELIGSIQDQPRDPFRVVAKRGRQPLNSTCPSRYPVSTVTSHGLISPFRIALRIARSSRAFRQSASLHQSASRIVVDRPSGPQAIATPPDVSGVPQSWQQSRNCTSPG